MAEPEIHPLIAVFQQRAEMLDMQGCNATSDDAIAMLAAFADANLDKLTEDDLAVLGEIGGILYRENLRRRME